MAGIVTNPGGTPGVNRNLSNEAYEYLFMKGKGLSDTVASGFIGNSEVETGGSFDPGIIGYNDGGPGVDAIGEFQWEGGRRTGLQQYAAQAGLKETDIRAQMGYWWYELQHGYTGILPTVNSMSNPADAAAYIDQHYEVSSGAARQQRMNDATAIFQALQSKPNDPVSVLTQGKLASDTATTAADQGGSSQFVGNGVNQSVASDAGKVIDFLGNGITGGMAGYVGHMVAPIQFIGTFFKKLVWLFDPKNAIRVLMYVIGALLIFTGLSMVIFGTGKDRPA